MMFIRVMTITYSLSKTRFLPSIYVKIPIFTLAVIVTGLHCNNFHNKEKKLPSTNSSSFVTHHRSFASFFGNNMLSKYRASQCSRSGTGHWHFENIFCHNRRFRCFDYFRSILMRFVRYSEKCWKCFCFPTKQNYALGSDIQWYPLRPQEIKIFCRVSKHLKISNMTINIPNNLRCQATEPITFVWKCQIAALIDLVYRNPSENRFWWRIPELQIAG